MRTINNDHTLTMKEFELFKELMYKKTGVFLKPSKRNLVIARLRSRLNTLQLDSFEKYYKLLINPLQKNELEFFINSITTNETFFFRNENQFNYLKNTILPKIKRGALLNGIKRLRIWSAASSTGEEAYSIAMILSENIPNIKTWQINIYASDINSDVLQTAKEGVYPAIKLKKTPLAFERKYFTKKTDKFNRVKYVISDEIKSMVKFFQHNLLNPSPVHNIDIIFVSNVLIYFDLESKQKVINHASNCLNKDGYLFLGQSESLMGLKHNFRFIMPSSFIKESD